MYKLWLEDEEKQVMDSLESIMERLQLVKPIMEKALIYSFLFQEYVTEDMESYKKFLEITQKFGYIFVLSLWDQKRSQAASTLEGQNYAVIRTCIKEYFQGLIGDVIADRIVVFVPYISQQIVHEKLLAIKENARCLLRKLKTQTGECFHIGIGEVRNFENMQESYQQAIEAVMYSQENVVYFSDFIIECTYDEDYPIHIEKKLFEKVEQGKINEAKAAAGEFFDWMARRYPDSITDIRLKVLAFVLWAEHIAYEKGQGMYRLKFREDYLSILLEMEELPIMRSWFVEKIALSCSQIVNKRKGKSNALIEETKEYIQKNYKKDLSLESMAKRTNVSLYYFSKVFKEETGKNFVEYLTGVRMEKAKELLWDNRYSIKEVCGMVGYSEPNYFSRTFKKNVGVTPTEYSQKEKRTDSTNRI